MELTITEKGRLRLDDYQLFGVIDSQLKAADRDLRNGQATLQLSLLVSVSGLKLPKESDSLEQESDSPEKGNKS